MKNLPFVLHLLQQSSFQVHAGIDDSPSLVVEAFVAWTLIVVEVGQKQDCSIMQERLRVAVVEMVP